MALEDRFVPGHVPGPCPPARPRPSRRPYSPALFRRSLRGRCDDKGLGEAHRRSGHPFEFSYSLLETQRRAAFFQRFGGAALAWPEMSGYPKNHAAGAPLRARRRRPHSPGRDGQWPDRLVRAASRSLSRVERLLSNMAAGCSASRARPPRPRRPSASSGAIATRSFPWLTPGPCRRRSTGSTPPSSRAAVTILITSTRSPSRARSFDSSTIRPSCPRGSARPRREPSRRERRGRLSWRCAARSGVPGQASLRERNAVREGGRAS